MGRKTCKRVDTCIEAMFLFGNKVCSGTISNFSKKSMLINTKLTFPLEWSERFDVMIFLKDKRLSIPVKIRNLLKTGKYYEVIYVDVIESTKEYLELIESYASEMQPESLSSSDAKNTSMRDDSEKEFPPI